MKSLLNRDGLTIVEIIMTIAVLGVVICPIMSLIIFSERINKESDAEYKSMQQAVKYMEEIQCMHELDTDAYIYNDMSGAYERTVNETTNNLCAEIKIKYEHSILYSIEIIIKKDGLTINTLLGSKIFL